MQEEGAMLSGEQGDELAASAEQAICHGMFAKAAQTKLIESTAA
jgi:hypothetical protein